MKRLFVVLIILVLLPLASCKGVAKNKEKALPKPEVDSESIFGVDKNINMSTIDDFLGRNDVVYIDVRMLFDSADFAAIGGDADLSKTIDGFKVVPYPYIGSLSELPVTGGYASDCLYEIEWTDGFICSSVKANYQESDIILSEIFPKDKAIFLMCGGGGYAGMMKALLIELGWNQELIYNVGGNWNYTGEYSKELIIYPEDASMSKIYATWRVDYTYIEFSKLQRIN